MIEQRDILVDGRTKAGTHVLVTSDVTVCIDGVARPVLARGVMRDGGTTFYRVKVPGGVSEIVFPNRIGDPDRTPRLDGWHIRY